MRLIDADALIELIESGFDLQFDEVTEKALVQMINEQDIAFDVEKVVAEIEKESIISEGYFMNFTEEVCGIVKRGGIE